MCGCKVKKNKRARHVKTKKHRNCVEGGGADGEVGGGKGWAELSAMPYHY